MAIKKGLGRGLDALLGDYADAPAQSVREADVRLIDNNTEQPRKHFDEEKLNELASSIKRHGMVQPIIVRQNGERFTIIAGERRFRAARIAGLERVPVIVKTFAPDEAMEVALIENLQREDLNPIEEAMGIRFLMSQHDLTQEEVASRLSKSRPAIANSLRLLNLPESVQELLRAGSLQAGHARTLAAIRDPKLQTQLAERIVETGASVREAEAMVKEETAAAKPQAAAASTRKAAPERSSDVAAAEDALRERLGTRVFIQGSERRGKIIIEYYSLEELQRIYEEIL